MKTTKVLVGLALVGWVAMFIVFPLPPTPTPTIAPVATATSVPTPIPPTPTPCRTLIVVRDSVPQIKVNRAELPELARRLNLMELCATIEYRISPRYYDPSSPPGEVGDVHFDGDKIIVNVYYFFLPPDYEWTGLPCGAKFTDMRGYMDCTAAHEFRHIWQVVNGKPETERDAEQFAAEWLEETDIHLWQ